MQHARCSVIFMTICLIQLVIRPTRPASLIPDQPDYVGNEAAVHCQTTYGYIKKPPSPNVWITIHRMKDNGDYTCKLNRAGVKPFLDRLNLSYEKFARLHKIGACWGKLWLSRHGMKVGYPPYKLRQLRKERREAEAKTYDEDSCKKHCEAVEGWIVDYRLTPSTHGKGKDHGNHHTDIKTHDKGTDHGNHHTDIKTHGKGTDHGNHRTDIKTHDKGTDHGNHHTDIKAFQELRRIHITRSKVDKDKKCHCDLNDIEVREFLAKQEKELLNYNFARLWGDSHSEARQFLTQNGILIGYGPRKPLAEWFKEPL